MKLGFVHAPVKYGYPGKYIVRIGFGIFNKNIEIGIIVKYHCIDNFKFRIGPVTGPVQF